MSIDTAHICKWLSMLQPMHHTGAQSKNDFQLCMMDPGCHCFPARFLNSKRQKLFLCFLRKHLSLSAHELCWHSVLNNKVLLRSSGVIRLLSKALLALRGKVTFTRPYMPLSSLWWFILRLLCAGGLYNKTKVTLRKGNTSSRILKRSSIVADFLKTPLHSKSSFKGSLLSCLYFNRLPTQCYN